MSCGARNDQEHNVSELARANAFCPRCTAVVLTSTHSIDRCVKCGGPDGFHDPACVVHPMDHQPSEQEQG